MQVMLRRVCSRYGYDDSFCKVATRYACDNSGWKQHFLKHMMKVDTIFIDAEELGFSSAMSSEEHPKPVERCDYFSGGRVCSQNSSQNPSRADQKEHVQNYAVESGDTLQYFASSLASCGASFGFGENVVFLASSVCPSLDHEC